jgi:hypothetical protein
LPILYYDFNGADCFSRTAISNSLTAATAAAVARTGVFRSVFITVCCSIKLWALREESLVQKILVQKEAQLAKGFQPLQLPFSKTRNPLFFFFSLFF